MPAIKARPLLPLMLIAVMMAGAHAYAQDSARFEARVAIGRSIGKIDYESGTGIAASGMLGWRISEQFTISAEARYFVNVIDSSVLYGADSSGRTVPSVVTHNPMERGLLLGVQVMGVFLKRSSSRVLPYVFMTVGYVGYKSETVTQSYQGTAFYQGPDVVMEYPHLGIGAGIDFVIAPSAALFVDTFVNVLAPGDVHAISGGLRVGF